jgi:hypothetical protein
MSGSGCGEVYAAGDMTADMVATAGDGVASAAEASFALGNAAEAADGLIEGIGDFLSGLG